jgi:hypothetical protein
MDKVTIDTRMESYSNFAREGPDGALAVRFDKKEGAMTENGHGLARDQYGKSGGAIFGVSLPNAFGPPTTPTKLVGIATRWDRKGKAIRGAGPDALATLLSRAAAGATR